MLKKIFLATVLSAGSTFALAAPANPTSVQQLMQLSHVEQLVQSSVQGMQPFFIEQSTQLVKNYTGHQQLSQKELSAVQQLAHVIQNSTNGMIKQANLGTIVQGIYAKTFTEEEVQAYIKFLSTPEGQSINSKTPILMTEMGQQMNSVTNRILSDKNNQIQIQNQVNKILNTLEKSK